MLIRFLVCLFSSYISHLTATEDDVHDLCVLLLQGHGPIHVPETHRLSLTVFLFHYRKCNLFIKRLDERMKYKSELEKGRPSCAPWGLVGH